MAYERVRIRQELVRDLGSLARIIADRTTAALTFNDDRVAMETLAALKVKRAVTAACIYDGEGQGLRPLRQRRGGALLLPDGASFDSQASIENDHLHLIRARHDGRCARRQPSSSAPACAELNCCGGISSCSPA